MEKLKKVINKYGYWSILDMYIKRIETFVDSDFSLCIENSKALLESISKEICKNKSVDLTGKESINRLVKTAFNAIGYEKADYINTIGGSLSAIAHQIGNLRTLRGSTSHGKTIDELKGRNNGLDELTKEFLLGSTEIISCFLIQNFENENDYRSADESEEDLEYIDAEDFNEFWDDAFGEFQMGDYSYVASEILYNVDRQAYLTEYNDFIEEEPTEK